MDSIIDELYYENLSPHDLFRWTKEYKTLTAEYADTTDRLLKTLGRRQSKMLQTAMQQATDLTTYETKDYFHIGFCLGARFMEEVLRFDIP